MNESNYLCRAFYFYCTHIYYRGIGLRTHIVFKANILCYLITMKAIAVSFQKASKISSNMIKMQKGWHN